jgi:hypothetical protein
MNSGGASSHVPPSLEAREPTRRGKKKGSGGAPPFFLADSDCYLYLQQEMQKRATNS